MKNKLVLTNIIAFHDKCPQAVEALHREGFKLLCADAMTPQEIRGQLPDVGYMIASAADYLGDAWFAEAKSLKLLARLGTGFDNIDLSAAKKRNIYVCNTNGNANAVAEFVVCEMLSILRGVHRNNALMHQGQWVKRIGHEAKGKTLGLIGFGRIAQRIARLLSGFDMRIIAYDLYPNTEIAQELHVTMMAFEDVLAAADIISLHVPALVENTGMIGSSEFSKMKDGVYFINAARACLVDKQAFLQALHSGKIKTAAVDVYDEEPISQEDPILRYDDVLCTSHLGGASAESLNNNGMTCVQAILDVMNGRIPKNLVC